MAMGKRERAVRFRTRAGLGGKGGAKRGKRKAARATHRGSR